MMGKAIRRLIGDLGGTLTVRTFTQNGTDSYGDPIYTETDTDVDGYVTTPDTEPLMVRDASGEEVEVDAVVYVSEGTDVDAVGEDVKPSIVIHGSKNYRVMHTALQGNGMITCSCLET